MATIKPAKYQQRLVFTNEIEDKTDHMFKVWMLETVDMLVSRDLVIINLISLFSQRNLDF